MTAIVRAALAAVLAVSLFPVAAAGQDTSYAGLQRRVALLELANADLARRLRVLEARLQSEPSQAQPIVTSTKWREIANWRQLRRGMRMNEVRELLGEPDRVEGGTVTTWRWPDGDVRFMDDRVYSWNEPGR